MLSIFWYHRTTRAQVGQAHAPPPMAKSVKHFEVSQEGSVYFRVPPGVQVW